MFKLSFSEYIEHYMNESIKAEPTVELFEADEMATHLLDVMNNGDVIISTDIDTDGENITKINSITLDIEFKLKYIAENQHIIVKYTPNSEVPPLSLSEFPESNYEVTGDKVNFDNITNLADSLMGVEFKQDVTWPCEMKLDNANAQKKLDKCKTLGAAIELLLGPEEFIDKVQGFKSAHQSSSNMATRQAKAEERRAVEQRARDERNAGRSREELLIDSIRAINGVTNTKMYDAAGRYTKRIIVWYSNGREAVEIFVARTGYFARVLGQNFTGNDYANEEELLTWIKTKVKKADEIALSPRERMQRRYNLSRNTENTISGTYNKFISDAEAFLNGQSSLSKDDLLETYDLLMDNESKLSDAQMDKLGELYDALGLDDF